MAATSGAGKREPGSLEARRTLSLAVKSALTDTFPDNALPRLSDEWMAEIRRRSAALAAGMASPVPWELVRSEAIPDTLSTLTKRS